MVLGLPSYVEIKIEIFGKMKIMLPVLNDCEGKMKLAEGFHNAQKVCIYDSKKDIYEWISTKKINANIGEFSVELKQRGIESVISCTMQPVVLRIFSQNGLQVFKAEGNNLEQNIASFQNDKLNSFSTEETKTIMGCGSSCNSCSSTCN